MSAPSTPARVRSVRPCPTPDPKPDPRCRLVTGTFRHTTADILDVSVAGQSNPIGTTPAHPFWSEDRGAFIPAAQLRQGERLRTAHGTITQVTKLLPRPTPEPVYNLEVDVEHVYYVTADGVLVHNSYEEKGYRVMSPDEYRRAAKGDWNDSDLVAGDSTEMGRKWAWKDRSAAESWRDFCRRHGEDCEVYEVDIKETLDNYDSFDHSPQGIAIHIPIEDLGPARPVE